MSVARLFRPSMFACGLSALGFFAMTTVMATSTCAQSSLTFNNLSLFSDFDATSSKSNAFTGTFGKYGVSLASVGSPVTQHGLGGPYSDARLFRRIAEGDGLSLIGAYTVNQVRVAIDIRRSLLEPERHRASTEFGVGYTAALTESLSVGAGPTIGFGEVTPSRGAGRVGAADGARSLGLSGAATLNLSENWALTGVLGYRARTDGAKEESFFSVLGLGYRF